MPPRATAGRAPIPPIDQHGVIGDCETLAFVSAALVSAHGEIDWTCWPRADSCSIFGSLLGPTGRQLGDTPQALTHLAFISAAVALDGAIDRHDHRSEQR